MGHLIFMGYSDFELMETTEVMRLLGHNEGASVTLPWIPMDILCYFLNDSRVMFDNSELAKSWSPSSRGAVVSEDLPRRQPVCLSHGGQPCEAVAQTFTRVKKAEPIQYPRIT